MNADQNYLVDFLKCSVSQTSFKLKHLSYIFMQLDCTKFNVTMRYLKKKKKTKLYRCGFFENKYGIEENYYTLTAMKETEKMKNLFCEETCFAEGVTNFRMSNCGFMNHDFKVCLRVRKRKRKKKGELCRI